MSSPLIGEDNLIVEDNLSVAWGKAFLKVFHAGEIAPLMVIINGLDNAEPPEIPAIRDALDLALKANGKGTSCHESANTIFPNSLWNPDTDRHDLYRRYLKIYPHIRKYPRNRNGVYFQRFIAFDYDDKVHKVQNNVNQLDHIIETWNGGNHRRSALQAAVFDPLRDHTNQPQRGFPCLQQVAFTPIGSSLSVTGFYATQYIFERAYGNYLGLCRLGRFMAHEMGLRLSQIICIATRAVYYGAKRDLERLDQQVKMAIADSVSEANYSVDEDAHA